MKKLLVSYLVPTILLSASVHAQTPPSSYSQMISRRTSLSMTTNIGRSSSLTIPQDFSKPVHTTFFSSKTELSLDQKSVEISMDHYLGALDMKRTSWLQAQISENGKTYVIPLIELETDVSSNPKDYHASSHFKVDFSQLNERLKQLAPNSKIEIGPGTALYLQTFYPNFGHLWGGPARGGLITIPGTASAKLPDAIRPKDLDLAFSISSDWANQYRSSQTSSGLKIGGQIRSRLEGEGKFQIPAEDYLKLREELFKLASEPTQKSEVFGQDWEFSLESRYMSKDQSGQVIKDQHGFPMPDPMIDTYYDNKHLDAAKNDIALRYRWTEGNRSGAWNFKPGIGKVTKSGVVYRIEYGVDTDDNKPESIEKFANSDHPLNPFKSMKEQFPGQNPSDFLIPSVKLTDYRYKFKLKHKSGLVVEASLDDVRSENLRAKGEIAQYYQLELDIDHLSVTSNNVRSTGGANSFDLIDLESLKPWLLNLSDKATLDGKLIMHSEFDLESSSPIMMDPKNKTDFEMATEAIIKLRDRVTKAWAPGAQKYAMAVKALELLPEHEVSKSVKAAMKGLKKIELSRAKAAKPVKVMKCSGLF